MARHENHRALTGLITEAQLLRDAGSPDQLQVSWLEAAYAWFNENLPNATRPIFGIQWRKGKGYASWAKNARSLKVSTEAGNRNYTKDPSYDIYQQS